MKRSSALVWLILTFATRGWAEVSLPNLFSDHAVLQRDQPVRIWGLAAPGEKVTVQFHSQTVSATANKIGAWEVWLMPETAGGPYTITVNGSESKSAVVREDILVGDVWVASGQSNMAFALKKFRNTKLQKTGDQEIANANHPRIRLFFVKRVTSDFPLSDVGGSWAICSPSTVAEFSAVAYFFGRELSDRENVPIGLLESTWGGTPAQAWISFGALGSGELSAALLDGETVQEKQATDEEVQENFSAQNAILKDEGKAPLTPPLPLVDAPQALSSLYDGMIAPLTKYAIKGVIWYQGESDTQTPRSDNYARLFPLLISDWRNRWSEGDFPFLFVQISSFMPHHGDWGQVRDAQRRTLSLHNTGMAITLDVGDPNDIHPTDKEKVGIRLALIALGNVYGEKIEFASPEFREATTQGDSIRVWFSHAQGLNSHDQSLQGFEVAGDDHKFVPANAKLEEIGGEVTVVASSPDLASPRYVRYGWTNVVTGFLFNNSELPLGTFTSETAR